MKRFLTCIIVVVQLCVTGIAKAENEPLILTNTPQLKIVWNYLNGLRDKMRDPDSFIIEKLFIDFKDEGKKVYLICVKYRSKNGFGGYNRKIQIKLLKPYTEEQFYEHDDAESWSRLCTEHVTVIDPHTIGF